MELRTVATREEAKAHIANGGGAFFVMGKEGDTKTIWSPESPDEIEAAQEQFDRLAGPKGKYYAYRVGEEGERSTRMETFDPKAGAIIFKPRPLVGG